MAGKVLEVGNTDAFERRYMGEFRSLAAKYGEFVTYERDRGARDIGLHLTATRSSGGERMTAALCWFQMKGIMASTLSAKDFEAAEEIPISLEVHHLRFWFLQPMPTYLSIYVESVDKFLVLDIQAYVAETWGAGIMALDQKTATVTVSTGSLLDGQAFNLILTKSDVKEWTKALEKDEANVNLCRRDYDLIWHFGTADERGVEHGVYMMDWISKMRGQLYLYEKPIGGGEDDHVILREHWEYMMNVNGLEDAYPYLQFHGDYDEDEDSWGEDEDDNDDSILVTFKNGSVAKGENAANEYYSLEFGANLNDLGTELFESVKTLEEIGLLEISPGKGEFVSIAPWHSRSV
ncbi:MAG: hypothetical protein AAFR91_00105 [Pseudomonadota bacterium]